MFLNRPALSLGSGPSSVRDARRWVHQVCSDIGREDLVDCASLGVSELVTNALLHAEAPVQVRVRGTIDHPRIEVHDGSSRPPAFPHPDSDSPLAHLDPRELPEDLDDLLVTFGRGLDMVARAADAWGAEIEVDGKVLWFVPATRLAEDGGPHGVLTESLSESDPPPTATSPDVVEVALLHMPVRAHLSFQRHYRELHRELRLLAMAYSSDYPAAGSLSELFGALEGNLRRDLSADQVESARAEGLSHVDVWVRVGPAVAERIGQLSSLLDVADAFSREQRLLLLDRTPEQVRFQEWLLGQYVEQAAGVQARAWVDADPSQIRHTTVS